MVTSIAYFCVVDIVWEAKDANTTETEKQKRKVMEREKCIILPVFMKSLQKEYEATVGFNIQNKKIRDDINGAVFILQFFLEIF